MTKKNSKTNIVVNRDCTITSHMIDCTGKIYNNKWLCIKPIGRNYDNRMVWEFKCLNCGRIVNRISTNINQTTCECEHKGHDKYILSFYDWCIKNNHQDWIDLWDYDLNKYDIHEIGFSSSLYCYFKCNNRNDKHHSENYKLSNLTCGCQKGISCRQCNSFAQNGIDAIGDDFLNIYWDYDKNTVDPWELSKNSGKKVYLKCPVGKHESHEMIAKNATKRLYPCPECTNELKFSKLHTKVINYLNELGFDILQEFDCNLKPKNPKTGHYLPYDIEVEKLKLIIEVNGEQHYSVNSMYNKAMAYRCGMSYDEYFLYRKWIDEYKKYYALNNGYDYLEISYTEEKNENYKSIILNKINELKF